MTSLRNPRVLRTIPLMFVVALLWPSAYGKVIYVDDDAGGPNDGMSWLSAYVYLQDALADANSAEQPVEIRVAQGTYTRDLGNGYVPGGKQATFLLKSGVTLKGGFAGVGTDDPDAWDHKAHETVLSGNLGGPSAENSVHVVSCIEADATAVLDGLTITAGYAKNGAGGGMYNERANPTVRRCMFLDNYASGGGGMGNDFSNPTVTDCTFSGNRSGIGGGMYNHESQPIVESCVFRNNQRGMYCVESSPTLTHCLFVDNYASYGAGLYTWKASPTLIHCTFSNNRANSWGAGMLHEVEGHAVVINCIFWGNTPDQIRTSGGMNRSTTDVTYSNIQGGYVGEGNIDADPLFANPDSGDFHLKSEAGRWDQMSESWVVDALTSAISINRVSYLQRLL